MDSLLKRLQYVALKVWGNSLATMDSSCGLARGHMRTIFDRFKDTPAQDLSGQTLAKIAKTSGVRLDWLILGEVPIYRDNDPSTPPEFVKFPGLKLDMEHARLAHVALTEGATADDVQRVIQIFSAGGVSAMTPGTFYDHVKAQRNQRLDMMSRMPTPELDLCPDEQVGLETYDESVARTKATLAARKLGNDVPNSDSSPPKACKKR